MRARVGTAVDVATHLHPGNACIGEYWTRSALSYPGRQEARSKRGRCARVLLRRAGGCLRGCTGRSGNDSSDENEPDPTPTGRRLTLSLHGYIFHLCARWRVSVKHIGVTNCSSGTYWHQETHESFLSYDCSGQTPSHVKGDTVIRELLE